MATSIEVTGKSLDEALFRALQKLGKRPGEIDYKVLGPTGQQPGGEVRLLVTVRAAEATPPAAPIEPEPVMEPEPEVEEPLPQETQTPRTEPVSSDEIAQAAQQIAAGMLEAMNVPGDVVIREHGTDSDGVLSVTLDILGDDLGILIGRHGETLRALQFITRLIIGKQLQTWARVNVDVEHYKARREETLRDMAERMAERVQDSQEPVTLEAMPPHERRIIHMALRDNPYVTTKSYGDEGDRQVVVSPAEVE
jgi:spoIIIJ-associated protein